MKQKGKNLQGNKSLAVGVAYWAIYEPVVGLTKKIFKLWVWNRWVFLFCVRSTPLRGYYVHEIPKIPGLKTDITK